MHNKLPTDENLQSRGCAFPSMCSLCSKQVESTLHLFCDCSFALHLGSWFANLLNANLHFTNFDEIWHICDKHWSPQCKVVIQAGIINIISTIWFCRNQIRFQSKLVHWRSATN